MDANRKSWSSNLPLAKTSWTWTAMSLKFHLWEYADISLGIRACISTSLRLSAIRRSFAAGTPWSCAMALLIMCEASIADACLVSSPANNRSASATIASTARFGSDICPRPT